MGQPLRVRVSLAAPCWNMNFLNSTSSVILFFSFSIVGTIAAPLVASLFLRLFSRLFKFPKNDFKTALYCNLIILAVYVGVSSSLSILFLDQIPKLSLSLIFTILPLVISFIVGTYVVHRFYGSSLLKSFLALLLTGVTLFFVLLFVVMFIGFGVLLRK